MKKNKIVSTVLKVISMIIILIGTYTFVEYRLWRDLSTDFSVYLKIFLPILVLGFSGTLYGISILLDNNK